MPSITSTLKKSRLARHAYAQARAFQGRRQGPRLFENADEYARALRHKADDEVLLRTHDGLQIAIRRNLWDAEIVREIFFEQPYTRHLNLGPNPVIVDIGSYIGDFALYAVKYLDAAHVVAYEPTRENFAMLTRNVELNGFGDRIAPVRKAVGRSGLVVLSVQRLAANEIHASSHWYREAEQRTLPSVTLVELLDAHRLESVDLLKVDCEGGEYEIFATAPDAVFERIDNIAFEYHAIDGYEPCLVQLMNRLYAAGYTLRTDGKIVSASK
jgi:FkbM family methyltransferase